MSQGVVWPLQSDGCTVSTTASSLLVLAEVVRSTDKTLAESRLERKEVETKLCAALH